MVSTVYLIRHCEAEGNIYRRAHGHYDGYPTPNGTAQCRALAARMAAVPLTAVYASDLTRARYTAQAVAQPHGLTVQCEPGFREMGFGVWEDKPWGELARDDAQRAALFSGDIERFGIAGGETLQQVRQRWLEALARVTARHEGAVAIVSHGMAMRASIEALLGAKGLPHSDNTGITKIDFDDNGVPTLDYYADNSHLGELSTLGKQQWWRTDGRGKDIELCFDPVELPRELPMVEHYRRDAWLAVYGTLEGFQLDAILAETTRCAQRHRRAVVAVRNQGLPIGLLHLDTEYKAADALGHISLVELDAAHRGLGLGGQLVGHAVSVYRALGRSALHLRVADTNTRAQGLYARLGFERVAVEEAGLRPLYVMQKSLLPPVWHG